MNIERDKFYLEGFNPSLDTCATVPTSPASRPEPGTAWVKTIPACSLIVASTLHAEMLSILASVE